MREAGCCPDTKALGRAAPSGLRGSPREGSRQAAPPVTDALHPKSILFTGCYLNSDGQEVEWKQGRRNLLWERLSAESRHGLAGQSSNHSPPRWIEKMAIFEASIFPGPEVGPFLRLVGDELGDRRKALQVSLQLTPQADGIWEIPATWRVDQSVCNGLSCFFMQPYIINDFPPHY